MRKTHGVERMKYEYMEIETNYKCRVSLKQLNDLGSLGWRLLIKHECSGRNADTVQWILIRERSN